MPGFPSLGVDATQKMELGQVKDHDSSEADLAKANITPSEDFRRFIDPSYDYKDPIWLMHCDEILRRAQVFNERLRRKYGIVPEKYPVDEDTRPRFLRTPDRSDGSDVDVIPGSGRGARFGDGRLRPPFTPYPGKTDKATRDLARLIVFNLANPGMGEEPKYRVTSTMSPIAGQGRPFNPVRLVRSEPTVTRTSTIVTRSDVIATRAVSATSCLASDLISLTNTGGSTSSNPPPNARSSSAHSRLTPQARSRSPTISDVIRFRNRIGVLSDFLRNPRHKAPKPTVRSDSNASTQQGDPNSSGSEAK